MLMFVIAVLLRTYLYFSQLSNIRPVNLQITLPGSSNFARVVNVGNNYVLFLNASCSYVVYFTHLFCVYPMCRFMFKIHVIIKTTQLQISTAQLYTRILIYNYIDQ